MRHSTHLGVNIRVCTFDSFHYFISILFIFSVNAYVLPGKTFFFFNKRSQLLKHWIKNKDFSHAHILKKGAILENKTFSRLEPLYSVGRNIK